MGRYVMIIRKYYILLQLPLRHLFLFLSSTSVCAYVCEGAGCVLQ